MLNEFFKGNLTIHRLKPKDSDFLKEEGEILKVKEEALRQKKVIDSAVDGCTPVNTLNYGAVLQYSFKSHHFNTTNNFLLTNSKINQFYNFRLKNTFSFFFLSSVSQLNVYGFKSFWRHLRFWIIPLTLFTTFTYYSFFLKLLPFSKVLVSLVLLCNMFYLLFSGFVFFLKKYQYRLYTSAIQRFWRRSLIIFWLIEASLFVCFIYFIFNASQEPFYVYDNIQLYKTHYYSWRFFLLKTVLSSILIVCTYTLILLFKWNTFTKISNLIMSVTILLFYITWLEFYQFFHLMNYYGNSTWVYDFSDHLWDLELDFERTRIVNHFVSLALIAKFWHVIFAAIFWIFFLLRGLESSKYRYSLLVANLQNFLIIYFMGWLFMYPWLKPILRKELGLPFFWFFVNRGRDYIYALFSDVKIHYYGFTSIFSNLIKPNFRFDQTSYYYWFESTHFLTNTQFIKHNIRDILIHKLRY